MFAGKWHGVQWNSMNAPAQDGHNATVIPEKQMKLLILLDFLFLRNDLELVE